MNEAAVGVLTGLPVLLLGIAATAGAWLIAKVLFAMTFIMGDGVAAWNAAGCDVGRVLCE
jgi:cyanate permease